MASMISYAGCIFCEKDSSKSFNWDRGATISDNLSRLSCPYGQLKVLLEQSLAMAYFVKFLGLKCHDVVTEYINELNNDIVYRFTRTCGREFTGNFKSIFQTLNNLVKFNREGNWTNVDIDLVCEFLFDGNPIDGVPAVWSNSSWGKGALVPFLMYMNKVAPKETVFVDKKVALSVFHLRCMSCHDSEQPRFCIGVHHCPIGKSYDYNATPIDELSNIPILGFLSHFDWSTSSAEECIGIISEMCFHGDIGNFGTSMSHMLAYCFKSVLHEGTCKFIIDRCLGNSFTVPSNVRDILFRAFVKFIGYCTSKKGMALKDNNVIASAFGYIASTKEQKESAEYIRQISGGASIDHYRAFKKTMGSVEALQLISQNPTLITAQTVDQGTVSTEDTVTNSDDNKQETKSDDSSDKNQSTEEEPKEQESADNKEDDNSKPSPDEDGSEDLPSDDIAGDEEDATSDDTGSEPVSPAESSDSGTDQTSSALTESTPDEPETSDDNGIKFEFVTEDSATVDSVLFREEMDKFLTNVLTNPPKCMSPQDVCTLTALKRFWLHCLSIDTIKGIVEACIRLPKTVQNSIRKSTEKKQ